MASVRQLTKPDKSGRRPWVVEYTDATGKRRRETPLTGLKRDADAARQRIEAELLAGIHQTASGTVTFGHACEAWLRHLERRWKIRDGVSGYTLMCYRSASKHVIGPFRNRLLRDLSTRDFQEFVNEKRQGLAWATVNNMAKVIGGVVAFAIENEWLRVNPLKVKTLRIPGKERAEKVIPTKDEIRMILQAVAARPSRDLAYAHRNRVVLVVLALFAGLRRGEICGLQWGDIDFERGVIHVKHSLSPIDGLKDPKTAAGVRNIPMSDPVRHTLEWAHIQSNTSRSPFVLTCPRGSDARLSPVSVFRLWRAVLERAGLLIGGRPKYNFHTLRHVAASLLIQQGLDAFLLRRIIGHSSVAVTLNTYGHMFPDDMRGEKALQGAASEFNFGSGQLQIGHRRDHNAT